TQGPLLEQALLGLGDAVPAEDTWRPYNPTGGKLAIENLRLVRKVDMPFSACELALRLEGTTLTWKQLKVPISVGQGQLEFRSDGKGERGLSASFKEAGLPSKDARIDLALRYQTDPSEPLPRDGKLMDQLSYAETHVSGLSLTGDEKEALVKRFPEAGAALE